jgi:hypothetical protein
MYAMECLQVELFYSLQPKEVHGRPQYCLGDCFSVDEVVLVRLT